MDLTEKLTKPKIVILTISLENIGFWDRLCVAFDILFKKKFRNKVIGEVEKYPNNIFPIRKR